jgi:hypothetical protein
MRLVLAELPAELHGISLHTIDAIKLCEAAIREHALRPDPRYFSAASTALGLIRKRSADT